MEPDLFGVYVDPGTGPEELPFDERVLYYIVDLADDLPSLQGYGVLEAQVASVLAHELGIQPAGSGGTLSDYYASLPGHARAKLRQAASELKRRLLIEVYDDPERGWLLTPTRPGQQRVRQWQRHWAKLHQEIPPLLEISNRDVQAKESATYPSGTVTFLFTDIEGSTRLWQAQPDIMPTALARHDDIIRKTIVAHRGVVFKTMGDGFAAAFARAPDALAAAIDAQRALVGEPWDDHCIIRVRMALYTGEAEERDGDYFGSPVNSVARLLSTGHGGQILMPLVTQRLVRDRLPAGTELRDLGEHSLKDLIHTEQIFQVVDPGMRTDFPPLKTLNHGRQEPPASGSRYSDIQRAALLIVGQIDAEQHGLVRPSLIGPLLQEQGFNPNEAGRTLRGLAGNGVLKEIHFHGADESGYILTEQGRDEYQAEKS